MPELSVSAAVTVPRIGYVKKWKLSINITVLRAELFAVKQALRPVFVKSNKNICADVIFTV